MNKNLQKAIMNRSRLLNRYRKEKSEATRSAYKRQRNFCVKLLRKTKKEFYKNLNVKYITENKLFWKTVKPSFTDKTLQDERITLAENNKVVSDESKLVEIFGKYFGNIVQNLGIDGLTNISSDSETVTIRKAIEKYQNHPSIKVIRENNDTTKNFSFDCLPHDLLIAKLHAHGIKEGSLNLLFSYFKNRKQRVRLNNTYSEWIDILFGVPQGSILDPLLCNIFLCDLFLFLHDIPVANYADDSTPYCTGLKISDVLIKLENAAETLLQWFKDNRMKANPDKYHLLINNTKESFQIKIGNETVSNSKYEKLLGVKIDHELNFNEHVSSLCKKASQKLNALSRIASSMTFDQRRLILNSVITSHFSYCPIVWMFHSRKLNERINHIHEKVLRIV